MKNIIAYVNPNKSPNDIIMKELHIQIDNSLDLGWKKEDILFVTNFPHEHSGVKSIVVEDDTFYTPFPKNSKITATLRLFDRGLIGDDLYWLHDIDAYQVWPFTEEDVGLDRDIGCCNYGRTKMWTAGTMFFYKRAEDIFREIMNYCDTTRYMKSEQKAMSALLGNSFDPNESGHSMSGRVKLMDISYCFTRINLLSNYIRAEKPIKVAHFHLVPEDIDTFINGKNPVGIDLLPARFRKFFE